MAFESIAKVEVGDSEYTMLSASLANRVIKGVNAANNAKVLPSGICTVTSSDTDITFSFKTFDLVACDSFGNQKTYRLVGMIVPDATP